MRSKWESLEHPATDGDALDMRFEAMRRQVRAPGVSAGVLLPGRGRWLAADGQARVNAAVAMTPTTPSRIGSISKTFTSAAVLVLAERGAIGLDDPAVEHLPELRALRARGHSLDDVTIRRLLLHRSGLIGEPPTREWTVSPFPTITEVLERIDEAYLAIAPGSAQKYSNLGYALLGEIVARASRQAHERFVRETFLGPAGMTATTFEPPAEAALGYGSGIDGWVEEAPQELGAERAAGGMWSTPGDLLRWAEVALGRVPDVLSPATAALLGHPQGLEDPELTLGWGVSRHGERLLHGFTGAVTGFGAHLGFEVATGAAAVVLANGNVLPWQACLALLDIEVPLESPPRPVPTSPRDPAGTYGAAQDVVAYVERRDEKLRLSGLHAGTSVGVPLEPQGEDRLIVHGGRLAGEALQFERDVGGRVTGFTVAGWRYQRR